MNIAPANGSPPTIPTPTNPFTAFIPPPIPAPLTPGGPQLMPGGPQLGGPRIPAITPPLHQPNGPLLEPPVGGGMGFPVPTSGSAPPQAAGGADYPPFMNGALDRVGEQRMRKVKRAGAGFAPGGGGMGAPAI
jgi:hypothetical protein